MGHGEQAGVRAWEALFESEDVSPSSANRGVSFNRFLEPVHAKAHPLQTSLVWGHRCLCAAHKTGLARGSVGECVSVCLSSTGSQDRDRGPGLPPGQQVCPWPGLPPVPGSPDVMSLSRSLYSASTLDPPKSWCGKHTPWKPQKRLILNRDYTSPLITSLQSLTLPLECLLFARTVLNHLYS